jgi:hypothetical protein
MNARLKQPTAGLVLEYARKFDDPASQTGQTALALRKLFAAYPGNADLSDVLLKASVLNALYATNIYAVFQVARHIHNLRIDDRLKAQDQMLVEDVACVHVSGDKKRRNYSFATKYCSWHSPEAFPIYDRFVDELLWRYALQDLLFGAKRVDRNIFWDDYPTFVRTLLAFKDYYSLQQVSLRQIDKFLFIYAHELSKYLL